MTVVYILAIALTLFTCSMPLGVFSVIWEKISENMTVGIPYIAILRTLLVLGAVIAVILSDRIRRFRTARDLVIGAIALESLSLFGISLSRVFWHLTIWAVVLGFSLGLSLTLLCFRLIGSRNWKVSLFFSCSAAGIAAGVFILSVTLSKSSSWRAACQVLAIVQILLCFLLFVVRHTALRDVQEIMRKRRREILMERDAERKKLEKTAGQVDDRQAGAFLLRFIALYISAACVSLLMLCACLWPGACLTLQTGVHFDTASGIMFTCLGLASGRGLVGLLKLTPRKVWALCTAFLAAVLLILLILMQRGVVSAAGMKIFQVMAGFGMGPIFPNLLLIDDARLDLENERSMTGLIPAFYIGSGAVITPFTQALVNSGAQMSFPVWMLFLTAGMALCLMLGTSFVRKRET